TSSDRDWSSDVCSSDLPSNKLTSDGRRVYLERRAEVRRMNANLVEIDLVLQGQSLLALSRDVEPAWDYVIAVTRWTHPDRPEHRSEERRVGKEGRPRR